MGMIEILKGWADLWAPPEPELQTRSDSVDDLLARMQRTRTAQPWRIPSVRDALGVPAIFGIIANIANTVGTLSLQGYRNGARLAPEDRPRIIVRPDPFRRPGSFWRDSAWNLASRGEAWWWVAKRDADDSAMSLLNIPPTEITVEENERQPWRPVIKWRGSEMRNEDMRQITYVREPGELRGIGPLQMCGAAISVAVESQEWAANFYGDGGNPSTLIRVDGKLGQYAAGFEVADPASQLAAADSEAEQLRRQWTDRPNNVPRVVDDSVKDVTYTQPNEQGAQMLTARDFQVGEIARLLNYPMSLVGYAVAGSSLTYQNIGQELDTLTRLCLVPNFLAKFEEEMSDLLTRSTTCEFDVSRLLRADVKTRWEVYELATKVLPLDEAAQIAREGEGLGLGSIETAPVPFAPPQAIPTLLPIQQRSIPEPVRCDGMIVLRNRLVPCNRLLAEQGPFVGTCPRCKKAHAA